MVDRRAKTVHGSVVECPTHKRKRAFKTKVSKPTNKCPVCWACWLADRLETSVYEDDLNDLLTFSNAFTKTVKPSTIEYIETKEDE
jgi:hypothetical protein